MHFAFGRVRRRIALLRTGLFVVGQFIARRLPKYLFKLHQTAPAAPGDYRLTVYWRSYRGSHLYWEWVQA